MHWFAWCNVWTTDTEFEETAEIRARDHKDASVSFTTWFAANKFSLWIWLNYLFTFYELLHFLFTAFFQPITFIAENKSFILFFSPFSFEIADLLQDSERLPV